MFCIQDEWITRFFGYKPPTNPKYVYDEMNNCQRARVLLAAHLPEQVHTCHALPPHHAQTATAYMDLLPPKEGQRSTKGGSYTSQLIPDTPRHESEPNLPADAVYEQVRPEVGSKVMLGGNPGLKPVALVDTSWTILSRHRSNLLLDGSEKTFQ